MELDTLNQLLESPDQFKEIWLEGENGESLCALINGDVGWLMYLRFKGDPGFSSRNPNISSSEEVDFFLNNGQRDGYPKNWTYGTEILGEAMRSFLKDGKIPSQIEWHDDS